jgi:diguanylate cyclase (GGDEF)-like protein
LRNSVRFLLLGIGAGVITPLGLVLYALAVDGPVDPLRLGAALVIGGALALGAAGFLLGRKEDQLAAQNRSLRELSDRLQALSATDALTGLPNRRALDERLEGELGRAQRHGTPLAAVMIDLDHFKRLNDQHGHQAGDAVLRHVARVLDSEKRRGDIIARYGGEEFAAILPHADAVAAEKWAERVRSRMSTTAIDLGGSLLRVTASFGVAAVPGGTRSAQATDLLLAADRALYAAKNAGRNRVIVASADEALGIGEQSRLARRGA